MDIGASQLDRRRWRENLQNEVDSATVYEALAEAEGDEKVSAVYRKLAQVERAHAQFWSGRLGEEGASAKPRTRARLLAFLGRRLGPGLVLPTLARNEAADSASYDDQPDAVAEGFHRDERSHARVVQAVAGRVGGLARGRPWPSWRVATAEEAATPFAPRCWAPTTGWCRTSRW